MARCGVANQRTIRHDVNGDAYARGCTVIDVCSNKEISSFLHAAQSDRGGLSGKQTSEQSSRGHLVLSFRITSINACSHVMFKVSFCSSNLPFYVYVLIHLSC